MHDIKVFKDEERAFNPWTFTVDGQHSGMWCPNEHAANRIVSRLRLGRSSEAFGDVVKAQNPNEPGDEQTSQTLDARGGNGRGMVFPVEGKPKTKEVKSKSGKTKEREEEMKWKYTLDGEESKKEFDSEKEARTACAIEAFMTRGKLGLVKRAQRGEILTPEGDKCTVTYDGKSLIARTKKGETYALGYRPGQDPVFKSLVETEEDRGY